MTPVVISPVLNGVPVIDAAGSPVSDGLVHTYLSGTSTPAATYQDADGIAAQSNPIVLDTGGYLPAPLWLLSAVRYRIVITRPDGVLVWSMDGVQGSTPGAITTFPATADVSLGGNRIINVLNASAGTDAITRGGGDARYARAPATAVLGMGGNKITNLGAAEADADLISRIDGDGRYQSLTGDGSGLTGLTTPQFLFSVPGDITGDGSLTSAWNGYCIVVNSGSAVVLTINDDVPVDWWCTVIRRGSGAVTLRRQSTGTMNGSASDISISAQWNVAHLVKHEPGNLSVIRMA